MKIALIIALLLPITAFAADDAYEIVIENHQFKPAELKVPVGKKVKLLVENKDATPEEFESHSLNREKIIAGKSKVTIYIGPLNAGRYPFFGEFNQASAQGIIVAE